MGNSLLISGTKIFNNNAAVLQSHLVTHLEEGESEYRILLLQAKAINEPVVQYGPFVMNSQEEIRQAYDDYRRTEFGAWPWPRYDQVKDRNTSRFAKHANGTKEIK